MAIKGIFSVIITFLLVPLLQAQESTEGLSVISNPIGAEVLLIGDISIAGVSPVNFLQNLQGRYKLVVKKEGFETYRSKITLSGTDMNMNIKLKPKTRFKALTRSFLIPGWGQAYSGQKFKGGIFFTLSAVAGISFLSADSDFRKKKDRFEDLEAEYFAEMKYKEREKLLPALEASRKAAYDAESDRRLAIGLTAAAWAFNIVDLFFNFPDHEYSLTVSSLALKPDIDQGGAQLVLTHRF